MSSSAKPVRADTTVTRNSILDASIALFSELGYSGTSVRAIADRADVNVAAANYHFGSKENLLHAAFGRAIAPINEDRLERLRALQAGASPPKTTELVRAFVEPAVDFAADACLPQLLARVFAEPTEISRPLIEATFRPVVQPFVAALKESLPRVQDTDLYWRFHFMVGALLQYARFRVPPDIFGASNKMHPADGVEQLIAFIVAGLEQTAGKRP